MISQKSETRLRQENQCAFCKGILPAYGYHYICHVCGARFCYAHMNRHAEVHFEKATHLTYGD